MKDLLKIIGWGIAGVGTLLFLADFVFAPNKDIIWLVEDDGEGRQGLILMERRWWGFGNSGPYRLEKGPERRGWHYFKNGKLEYPDAGAFYHESDRVPSSSEYR